MASLAARVSVLVWRPDRRLRIVKRATMSAYTHPHRRDDGRAPEEIQAAVFPLIRSMRRGGQGVTG